MAFPQEETRIATAIQQVHVVLLDSIEQDENGDPVGQTARFSIKILDQNGEILNVIKGNLAPYLTQGEITALMDFMTSLRIQAETEIIP